MAECSTKGLSSQDLRSNIQLIYHELILKQGSVKISHFAHRPDALCSYAGEPESKAHLEAKLEIYEALRTQPRVEKLQVERYLKEVRPDISFLFEGSYVAIDVQISPLSQDELIRRTAASARKTISVLWTPIFPMEMLFGRYAPKEWERSIHALYGGTISSWVKQLDLAPVTFEPSLLTPSRYSSRPEHASTRFVQPKIAAPTSLLTLSCSESLSTSRRMPKYCIFQSRMMGTDRSIYATLSYR